MAFVLGIFLKGKTMARLATASLGIILILALCTNLLGSPEMREWSNKDGTRRVSGTFLGFVKDGIEVKLDSGKTGRIKFDTSCDDDWLYLDSITNFEKALVIGYSNDSPVVSNRLERLHRLKLSHQSLEHKNTTKLAGIHIRKLFTEAKFYLIAIIVAVLGIIVVSRKAKPKRDDHVEQNPVTTERRNIRIRKERKEPHENKGELCFLDLETTGLNTSFCDIIEICISDKEGVFATLIDPGRPIPASATEINGIDTEMIIGKPMFKDIADKLWNRINGKVIVGHNVSFDLKFLYHELKESGIENVSFRYICTCDTERLYRGPGGNRLYQCLERRGLNVIQTHRAKEDVEMLVKLFNFQEKEKKKHLIQSFGAKEYFAEQKREFIPVRPPPEKRRTSFTIRSFTGWGTKTDEWTRTKFKECVNEAIEDGIFDSEEMASFEKIGISKDCGTEILQMTFKSMASAKCINGKITWASFDELRNFATLLGIQQKFFFDTLRQNLPSYHTVCFSGELELCGEPIDRYDVLYPWAVENNYLPMDSVLKQTTCFVYCRPRDKYSTKSDKAHDYKIPIMSFEEFANGKTDIMRKV